MGQVKVAHGANELRYYLMVTACPACGAGPWEIGDEPADLAPGQTAVVQAACRKCGHGERFEFHRPERDGDADDAANAETINPGPNPSEIIDLSQWLSLFYLLTESAAKTADRAIGRTIAYRAALCLSEALKFYDPADELPPGTAFFTAQTLETYRNHPEKFARRRLLDLEARLPHLSVMSRRLAAGRQRPRRRWWQFWRA